MAEDKKLDPLLKRVFMFLEDGDWSKADSYCEKVLDQDPENAQAYLGKLMAELQIRRQEALPNCEQPFNISKNYQKAVRFGGEEFAGVLSGYIDHINERNENARLTDIYNKAVSAMKRAYTESEYKSVAKAFKTIPGFLDADDLAEQCFDKAEVCRKNAIYDSAREEQKKNKITGCESAIKLYESIPGWKNADEQIEACQRKIVELKAKEEADRLERKRQMAQRRIAAKKEEEAYRLERERQMEQRRIAAKKTAKRRICIIAITVSIVFVLIVGISYLTQPPVPSSTSKNVRIIHNIYEKDKLDNKSKKTLYNFGLNVPDSYDDKQWNGTWIVTEDFVKEYIEKYSAEEFVGVYQKYIASYLDESHKLFREDKEFYDSNPELFDYISGTTRLLFEMPELFEVVNYNPATDEVINETSETNTVSGRFNAGLDNHIEWRESYLTIDTYEYSDYYVEHRHGYEYDDGEYGWVNGEFHDVPASFVHVDNYRLYVKGVGVVSEGKSLNDLNCTWISIGGKKYYGRVILGTYYVETNKNLLSKSVYILTDSAWEASEPYIKYYNY